jgi:hypothetical protein
MEQPQQNDAVQSEVIDSLIPEAIVELPAPEVKVQPEIHNISRVTSPCSAKASSKTKF